jgi:hypothetical protein
LDAGKLLSDAEKSIPGAGVDLSDAEVITLASEKSILDSEAFIPDA